MSRARSRLSAIEGACRACGRRCTSVALTACPDCGGVIGAVRDVGREVGRGLFASPQMLFQNNYVWFVLVSALDVMLTWIVLLLDGVEANPIADAVLQYGGLPGMVAFKFALVLLVVVLCEWTGRRNLHTGWKLSEWAVAITTIPVTVAFVQLLVTA
ncbi:MAG: hypothetical protein H6817_08325 [Phycisphaerales bacterium]|nr:hypothetical protein [Phycisphaerales bacterium]